MNVSKVIVHPNYKWPTIGDDIAILKLAKNLVFSNTIKPIKLPPKRMNIKPGTLGIVLGWGFLSVCQNQYYKNKIIIMSFFRSMENHHYIYNMQQFHL